MHIRNLAILSAYLLGKKLSWQKTSNYENTLKSIKHFCFVQAKLLACNNKNYDKQQQKVMPHCCHYVDPSAGLAVFPTFYCLPYCCLHSMFGFCINFQVHQPWPACRKNIMSYRRYFPAHRSQKDINP